MRRFSIAALGLGAAAALAPLYTSAQVQPEVYDCRWGPHMMGWGGGWYGMFFGPLMMVVLLVVVIGAVVLVLRWSGVSGHGFGSHRTPLNILRERFARGEINKEEFEERRKVLGD